ncbi:SPRY-domain-containing protein [Schizophyllum commune H4-8]|uniref:B30.2/SPRY domain-containing protein n=1 Tax=Schizophyllum commune (strain H4-8 / FGSC 9210) TaxID=578458 RepID=D8PQX1_SCHCM|nr:SPRY-domain-containing protein [Schizophyllum commune H4-8]KAI5898077.1 SPRY-domain-containing protein [Schizophyllum commune H4-8]
MARALKARGLSQDVFIPPDDATWPTFNATAGDSPHPSPPQQDALMILLPLLIVLSTFLFLLLVFLICVLLVRRRRGIALRDSDGPVDMSREELIDGEGGFEGVESRWLETVPEHVQRDYRRAKEYQLQYPPNSFPTDITLSQFLSIQEKGVSAWCFEPDFETVNNLLVQARTEITFLPDPASASCVQSNLPLPKLNEVYYWEVKMFDLPITTNVSVGLATKPYPQFSLPGMNRYSVAYHSNGDISYNYPFTASSFGPGLKEGDVLGVGYRPRSGTVFFTRNGRKMDDAFIGLSRWNLFPSIGADGPCSVHVNLGQAGFVFIEANVKKWGLAPSVGTLAPPPAYGSERGSILLDVGGRPRPDGSVTPGSTPGASSPTPSRRSHRSRRPKPSGIPNPSSPLRPSGFDDTPMTPPPPITPIIEEIETGAGPSNRRYISPTDLPFHAPPNANIPASPPAGARSEIDMESPASPSSPTARSRSPSLEGAPNPFITPRRHNNQHSISSFAASLSASPERRTRVDNEPAENAAELVVQVHPPPPESPLSPPNPPTPNMLDIGLQSLPQRRTNREGTEDADDSEESGEDSGTERFSPEPALSRRTPPGQPPAYSPLDAVRYADGVQIDLPAEVISAALEGSSSPPVAQGRSRHSGRSRRR